MVLSNNFSINFWNFFIKYFNICIKIGNEQDELKFTDLDYVLIDILDLKKSLE